MNGNKKLQEKIDKWGSTLHNDLYRVYESLDSKNQGKKYKDTISRLKGLQTSLSLDSCSGLLYIYKDKVYKNPGDIDMEGISDDEVVPVLRVIDVEYLSSFLEDIIRR